jgi:hypothetical protein
MTAVDFGRSATLFVTNVLNGTVAAKGGTVNKGTVVRIRLRIGHDSIPVPVSTEVIATGFAERTDPNALVIGPTGVALGRSEDRNAEMQLRRGEARDAGMSSRHGHESDVLFVADTVNSRIAAVPDALQRTTPLAAGGITVSSGGALNGPLGLAVAPGGDIVTANGGDGNLVETTPSGHQVATKTVDPAGAGVLFGLVTSRAGVYFVDDGDNTLRLLH